jgi:hypothetical protein
VRQEATAKGLLYLTRISPFEVLMSRPEEALNFRSGRPYPTILSIAEILMLIGAYPPATISIGR